MTRHLLVTIAIAAIAGILSVPVDLVCRPFRRLRRRLETPARMPA